MSDFTLISSVGLPTILVIIIINLIANPDKAQRYAALFHGLWSSFSVNSERKAVAYNAQSIIGSFASTVNKQIPDFEAPGIKIEWITSEKADNFMEDGTVVIRLKDHRNKKSNLSAIARAYVEEGITSPYKAYLGVPLRQALQSFIVVKILRYHDNYSAFSHFVQENLEPILNDPNVKEAYKKCEEIDSRGHLTRLALRELYMMVRRHYSNLAPTDELTTEIVGFFDWLHTISTRPRGRDARLSFDGHWIRCAIVLAARDETLDYHGTEAFERRIKKNLSEGYRTVYVMALGHKRKVSSEIASLFEDYDFLTVTRTPDYTLELNNERVRSSLCVIHNSYDRIQAIQAFRNLDYVDNARTIYATWRCSGAPIVRPSSGFQVQRVFECSGEIFFNILEMDSEYEHKSVKNTSDLVPPDRLDDVSTCLVDGVPNTYTQSYSYPDIYFRYSIGKDGGYLDLIISAGRSYYFFINVPTSGAMDSTCIDIAREAAANKAVHEQKTFTF